MRLTIRENKEQVGNYVSHLHSKLREESTGRQRLKLTHRLPTTSSAASTTFLPLQTDHFSCSACLPARAHSQYTRGLYKCSMMAVSASRCVQASDIRRSQA